MAESIQINSFNQILGQMIRTIIAQTPLSDLNAGSVLLTLLEACAANDYENNTAILNILELLNIDAVQNSDLDDRAGDYGLTRLPAIAASGLVNILNNNITKQSSGLYILQPAPIAGQTVLYLNNTTGWTPTGTIYIGRGTQQFEGPIPYTSIITHPTFSQLNLGAALQRDHLSSEQVVNSQGQPDQQITAGTVINIPANNQNPQIEYSTLVDAVIPAGEISVNGVQVIAQVAGSSGNAGINTITAFDTLPFAGAGVTNSTAFTNGADQETDTQLRNRIKNYATTLARGTASSIINAVIGVSDPVDSLEVASAVISEPAQVGLPAILYIDDGFGLQPSYVGQSVDTLLTNATGTESFLQLANFPLPRPQVVNTNSGPYNIVNGSFLRVIVDGVQEDITFLTADFANISAATLAEIIIVINNTSTLINARFVNESQNLLIYPIAPYAEIIQVAPMSATDSPSLYLNSLLLFPTNEFSYISMFRNATRLHSQAHNASVETVAFGLWNIASTGDLVIAVDGTPAQDQAFPLSNFSGASSFAALTLNDWVDAFNNQFAGITATATASQTMVLTSNKVGAESSLNIESGSLLTKMFPNVAITSVGQTSDFALNRQTGNLQVFKINPGDNITAGIVDAKGFDVSAATSSGTYNVDADAVGRPANLVVVADSSFCNQVAIPLLIGSTMDVTNPSGSVMRITSSTLSAFQNVLPGDFVYIIPRTVGWLDPSNCGLFKIVDRGHNIIAGSDSYIDVENATIVLQAAVPVLDSTDVQAFRTDGFPQVWRGQAVINPAAATLDNVVNSFNDNLINVKASVYHTTAIKITSTTEKGGSIAVPVATPQAQALFATTATAQLGNPPQIANLVSDKDLISSFKRTTPTAVNVWLGRYTYTDLKGVLDADTVPDPYPYVGTYGEILTSSTLSPANVSLDDYISFNIGNNRDQFKTVQAQITSNQVGTQEGTARTELDYIAGDEFELVRPLQLSKDDTVVIVMDENPQSNTINIPMARLGQINSGSNAMTFIPTNTEFSANDADNQPGIDFSNTVVWGTSVNDTNFADYNVWFQARNWYVTGGIGNLGVGGAMIVRAAQFGPNGEAIQFALAYPTVSRQTATTVYSNTASQSFYTYYFGSGNPRSTAIPSSTTITITNSGTNQWDYLFSAGTLTSVLVGDILSILPGSGVSAPNGGQLQVLNISGNTLTVYSTTSTAMVETISNTNLVSIFPLAGTMVSDICTTINAGVIMTASPVAGSASLMITTSTATETTNTVAFGYTAGDASVSLYDAVAWVKLFENSNPNFILKNTLVLQGAQPSIYSMDTAPNTDSTLGEYFSLIPSTVKNVYHQFTQPALSQLPIVADIAITNDRKNVQIDSKSLGSAGAVEIVGGNANKSQAYIINESEVVSDINGPTLQISVPAFPDTFNVGDFIKLQNDAGVQRLSRLAATDHINVTIPGANEANYNYDPKATLISSSSTFTITSVSGLVWKWENTSNDATFANVNPGDQLFAFGPNALADGWSQGNLAGTPGNGFAAGLTIVAVDNTASPKWVEVVNPHGVAMATTAVGAGNTVQICPTPVIRWNLAHAAKLIISTMNSTGTVVTVTTETPHFLETGDSVTIADSFHVPDGAYSPVTVLNINQFRFAYISASFTETLAGASAIKTGVTPTRYRVESLGFNGMLRIAQYDGASPRFLDSGVAVDDYVVLSGTTFAGNNNGTFRVAGVDSTSLIVVNPAGSDQLDTIELFNNNSLQATWTVNTNLVTGTAGTFKYLTVGDWVKKAGDSNDLFLQVTGIIPAAGPTATSISLGGNYGGTSGVAAGVFWDETMNHNTGIYLQSADDLAVYEGDSALSGDTLSVQNIINSSWFNVANIGNFTITSVGTDTITYKPFLQIINPSAFAQAGVSIAINTAGFYVTESLANRYYSIRQITHVAVDAIDNNNRDIYMIPSDHSYKFTNANATSILSQGKFGYSTEVTTGVDGYLYYTGLLQTVQRLVDGFEPDATDYPGLRAVGGLIETLPPLVNTISIAVNVATNNGVNLGDISDSIQSVIIDYVQGLGVGQDVILSEIIAQVMNINGVAAVMFTEPAPSTERITIAFNERANITPANIGIANG